MYLSTKGKKKTMIDKVYEEIKNIVDFDSPLLQNHIADIINENIEYIESFQEHLRVRVALRLCGVGFKRLDRKDFASTRKKNTFFKQIVPKDSKVLISLRNKVVKSTKEDEECSDKVIEI